MCDTRGLNQLLPGISPHSADKKHLNASELTGSIWPSPIETRQLERRIATFYKRIASLASLRPSTTALLLPIMDPPRTRSRSRSGFYHFSMNGNVGGNGNAAGSGSIMGASGGGGSFPQQSNPGWAPHHGGRSYPENQQQHNQGSYLSAGAQRHSAHGAHRHPGTGELALVEHHHHYIPGLTEYTPSGM